MERPAARAGGGEPAAGAGRHPPGARRGERLPEQRRRMGGARPRPGPRQARPRPRRLGADRRAAGVRRRARHRRPEFEDWIRDQRVVFAERLEAAGPPRAVAAVRVAGPPGAGRVRGRAAVDRGHAADAARRPARGAAGRRGPRDGPDRAADPVPPARRDRLQLHLGAAAGPAGARDRRPARGALRHPGRPLAQPDEDAPGLRPDPRGDRAGGLVAQLRPRLRRPLRRRARGRVGGRGRDDGGDRPPRALAGAGARSERPRRPIRCGCAASTTC